MGCCTTVLHLSEDNARFLLLAAVAVVYMLLGALIFQLLEEGGELRMEQDYWTVYYDFCNNSARLLSYNDVNFTLEMYMEKVHDLLQAHSKASAAGVINKRRRWDFPGSFHFVGTIVSTIGYGNTTPQTAAGKATVILYGFFGCSIGILFFNLFLERIITLLAFILRSIHVRRLRKRIHQQQMEESRMGGESRRASRVSRVPSELDEDSSLDSWKPSVYWVMLCLVIASTCITLTSAAVYSPAEGWTFLDAIYFSFVSFATIGFGDMVSTQEKDYSHVHWYRFGNFCFLVMGCSCIYSLFNVTSIVIKQLLNWVIFKLDCRCMDETSREAGRILRRHSMIIQKQRKLRRRRSSVAMPGRLNRAQLQALFSRANNPPSRIQVKETSGEGDSDSQSNSESGRRTSGELISMKDFLQANKVSLAVMQKQLYETAQLGRGTFYEARNNTPGPKAMGTLTPGTVGPLAIACEKLDTSNR